MAKKLNTTNRILGLPMTFPYNVDPMGRVFAENFLSNGNIINIAPGRPEFRGANLRKKKLQMLNDAIEKSETSDGYGLFSSKAKRVANHVDDNNWESNGWFHNSIFGLPKDLKEKDIRFYSFKSDFRHFLSTLNTMVDFIASGMMGWTWEANVSKYFDTSHWGDFGISFWVEGSSQCSESISNDVGETSRASESAANSDAKREAAFLLGKGTGSVEGFSGNSINSVGSNTAGGMIGKAQQGMAMYDKAKAFVGQGVEGAAKQLLGQDAFSEKEKLGERIVFPKMWKNSTYDKTYNLSFRFISPYGDPESIFLNVYVPFLILLAMALPKQYSADSYGAPPIIRIDSPGNFQCDMGMISSLSFQKGTSQELWTTKGLPLGIDVNVSVVDMYPSLSAPTNSSLLKQNIGMSSMLQNMAGLSLLQANLGFSLWSSIQGKIINWGFGTAPGSIKAYFSDVMNHVGEAFGVS